MLILLNVITLLHEPIRPYFTLVWHTKKKEGAAFLPLTNNFETYLVYEAVYINRDNQTVLLYILL